MIDPTATTLHPCPACRRETEHVERTRWTRKPDGTSTPRQVKKCIECSTESEFLEVKHA